MYLFKSETKSREILHISLTQAENRKPEYYMCVSQFTEKMGTIVLVRSSYDQSGAIETDVCIQQLNQKQGVESYSKDSVTVGLIRGSIGRQSLIRGWVSDE